VFDPQEDDSGNVNYLIPQPTQKQAEGLEADGSRHPDANLITNSNEGCIPIIVHNGLMDLLFLMTHFHHPILPETWQEAKALVHSFFPKVCDTKYLAEECCPISYHSTKLEDMFNATVPPPQGRAAVQTSTNERASGAHEAGKKSSSINQSLSLSLLILYFKSWPYKYFKILSLL
jgi:hypothetical protein